MSVCTGITYSAEDDRITVEFVDGDVKGNSFDDPYTFQDIYDTDVDGGWNVFKKYGNVYISDASIWIEGSDTYFQDTKFILVFQGNISDTRLFYCGTANLKIIEKDKKYAIFYNDGIHDGLFEFDDNIELNYVIISGNDKTSIRLMKGTYQNILVNNSGSRYCFMFDGTYSNIYIYGGYYGYRIGNVPPQSIANIYIVGANNGVYFVSNNQKVTIQNLRISGCDYDFKLYPGGNGAELSIIDSQVNIDSYDIDDYQIGDITIQLKSTFKINISGGDSGTATLYDKDDNQIAQQTLSGEWELTNPVTYAQRYVETDGSQIVENTKTLYEPFKLVVTKNGYNTLEIPNIFVTAGEETNVYGEMVANPAPLEFTINDVLERVFSDSVNLTVTETINRWGQSKELSFTGSTTDSDSYRITYQPVTNTYLIEQYIDGVWETAATLSSGDILTFQSDIEALIRYVDRSLTGSISTQNVTGTVQAVEIEGSI